MTSVRASKRPSLKRVAEDHLLRTARPNWPLKLTNGSLPSVGRSFAAERHDRWTDEDAN
jgi:hypothetical protein